MRGCRIRDVSDCTIQRCVIRHSVNTAETGDTSGIQVRQFEADEMVGIKIIDNEIYNVGDGIQLTAHEDEPLRPVEVVIEGNDIYLEPSRYLGDSNMTWDENGIDIKVGSDRPESTIVRRNRMWGFRRRDGNSEGEPLVVQKFCRNLVVEDNIMGDAPRGMKDEGWPDREKDPDIDPRKPRNVVFRRNQFYEIRDRAKDDVGAITRPITAGIRFERNWFARSDFLADATPPRYKGMPLYEHNTRVGVPNPQRPNKKAASGKNVDEVPYSEPPNHRVVARMGFDTYERKRWTGRERVIGAIPAGPPVTHGPPDDPLHG